MEPGMASNISIVLSIILMMVKCEASLPACEVNCIIPDTLVADPFDCNKYYICTSDGDYIKDPVSCPDNQLFEPVDQRCVDPNVVEVICPSDCERCTYNCDDAIVKKAANEFDCLSYYDCSNFLPVLIQCENGLYFDGNTCQDDISKCCACRKFCTQEYLGYNISDLHNCTNYYRCDEVGFPDESHHVHCTLGYFDEATQSCSTSNDCENACRDNHGCTYEYVCSEIGYFPKCTEGCSRHYYSCDASHINQLAETITCSDSMLLHPDLMLCVEPILCPYPQE
ncbi:uncharacterized protein [Cherax quadricarinatus]